jgi:hypothetical protein
MQLLEVDAMSDLAGDDVGDAAGDDVGDAVGDDVGDAVHDVDDLAVDDMDDLAVADVDDLAVDYMDDLAVDDVDDLAIDDVLHDPQPAAASAAVDAAPQEADAAQARFEEMLAESRATTVADLLGAAKAAAVGGPATATGAPLSRDGWVSLGQHRVGVSPEQRYWYVLPALPFLLLVAFARHMRSMLLHCVLGRAAADS